MGYCTALILSSKQVYYGNYFGYPPLTLAEFSKRISHTTPHASGELVFNTAMSGYVEVLSDPSFYEQLVCMTYPHIGNYGVDLSWSESGSNISIPNTTQLRSKSIMASGLVVRELYDGPIPEGRISLSRWLEEEGVSGITGIDTRTLTIHLRDNKVENAAILFLEKNRLEEEIEEAYTLVNMISNMEGKDLVSHVCLNNTHTINTIPSHTDTLDTHLPTSSLSKLPFYSEVSSKKISNSADIKMAVLDCGCKYATIQMLAQYIPNITLLSDSVSSEDIVKEQFDLLLVSNGPGDPSVLNEKIVLLQSLLGKITLCGICLGTQLLALTIGASTYKLPFGHHGINHPVKDILHNKLYITSQNHGFAVDENTLPQGAQVWFRNTNDDTLEGFIYPEKKIYSVQFHPEAAPGPTDTMWILHYFIHLAIHNRMQEEPINTRE